MGYRNMGEALRDLEKRGELVRIEAEVDPRLEVGAIQRRVFRAGGPAVLFTRVKGTAFPMVGNVFGTRARVRFLFRHALKRVEALLALKADPAEVLKRPWKYAGTPLALWQALPRTVKNGPVLAGRTTVSQLPRLVSWPGDGGAYVTLPQVYSESPDRPGFAGSNLGMYRVQLSGGELVADEEVGLHYQIHRGIGPHHAQALARGEPLPVNVFVGGPPALTLAAVMPLPEGVPELFFAGAIGGRRIDMVKRAGVLPVPAEADFCLVGEIRPGEEKPEGPFGDHLGYYSLAHPFPVMRVRQVLHRKDAVWPFTTVGRPPQEDTVFGSFIHELTAALVPTVFSGVVEVHAVDAAGVHPLLLAVGRERYVPYARERMPQEILTAAFSLLGQTQTSLSKFVLVAAREDDPELRAHDVPGFFRHVLERLDLGRDLHFVTRTTMDTLDYSGISLNQGSKVVWAAAGEKKRELAKELPAKLGLPEGFGAARVFAPGIIIVQGPRHGKKRDEADEGLAELGDCLDGRADLAGFPLLVVADDAAFTAASWENFLWVTFTRADPATDTYGAGAAMHCKHWGCRGPMILDARLKAHHAPPLEDDPEVEKRVDELGAKGGPLAGII